MIEAISVSVSACFISAVFGITLYNIFRVINNRQPFISPSSDTLSQRLGLIIESDLDDEDKVALCQSVLGTAETNEGAAEQPATAA